MGVMGCKLLDAMDESMIVTRTSAIPEGVAPQGYEKPKGISARTRVVCVCVCVCVWREKEQLPPAGLARVPVHVCWYDWDYSMLRAATGAGKARSLSRVTCLSN